MLGFFCYVCFHYILALEMDKTTLILEKLRIHRNSQDGKAQAYFQRLKFFQVRQIL